MRPSRAPRLSLLARFGLVSLLVVVAIGVALGLVLQQSVRSRAIADAARTGQVAADVGVRPFLTPDDLSRNFVPLDPARIAELDGTLGASLSPGGVVRLKVWNRQHWIVYSDNPRLRGRWFAGAPILERTFDGELTSEITDLRAPEEREERDFGTLLAVYVPLRIGADGEFTNDPDAEVIGAFEIYLPWAPIAADIRADTRRLWMALALGIGVLYLSVVRLVARASRRLQTQAAENLHLASHDGLTGLANRDAFLAALGERRRPASVRSASAGSGFDLVLMFDVDGFQTINDTLGHDRGDRLLVIVARRFAAVVRDDDLVARMGGDEFAVLIRHVGDEHDAARLIGRFLEALDEPIVIDGLSLEVRASVGAAVVAGEATEPERVLRQADIALYAAKARHSRLEFYAPELDDFSPEALELASEVRAGIETGQFVLHLQPKIDLATGEVVGAEALVRWNHPDRGMVPPGRFMPTVEQLPIGRDLTDSLIDQAAATAARWQAAGRAWVVSVNLSSRDAADPALPGVVERALVRHGADPAGLLLELTEGTAITDEQRVIDTLGRLRSMGCGVALDDFGTGYASLSYLAKLPATELKIDQSFVRHVLDDPQALTLVRHCVDVGHSLGMKVTAEGIETAEVAAAIRDLGCDLGQGYLFARPLPLEEMEAVVDTEEFARTVGSVATENGVVR